MAMHDLISFPKRFLANHGDCLAAWTSPASKICRGFYICSRHVDCHLLWWLRSSIKSTLILSKNICCRIQASGYMKVEAQSQNSEILLDTYQSNWTPRRQALHCKKSQGWLDEDHTTLLGMKCQGGTEWHIIAHRKMNNIARGLRFSFQPCAPEWVTSTLWIA